MARYFLDTGVLVGLTFLHDLWHDDAERLYDTDNGLYTSRAVVYEYCNNSNSSKLEDTVVDWDTDDGLFGATLAKVRAAQMNLNLRIDGYDDDELDIETLVEAFLEETDVMSSIKPQRLIEEHIEPNIRNELENTLTGEEVTRESGRRTLDSLCDTVINEAHETRQDLQNRLTQGPSGALSKSERRQRLGFVDGYMDKVILSDAAYQNDRNIVSKVVTADKSDMYGYHERISAELGIQVIYIKDELADPSWPTDE
ncbi:hypothetical protein [Halorubrum tebenquichense]|uniref:DUF4935 domain-containing protein n=1 Tax=Halorubrum tebenquichense DSM 14210 TaxID=1227485 RepID=M0DDP8_9EURY|nr:hypothetical protein [Halorubrum tebenquichense]ELZ32867.1 hypothetical protein C472_15319 [Halorubrum tebenquichense DSM 14210]